MYIRKKNEKAFIFLKNSGDSAANSIKIISCGVNSAIESLQALRDMFAEKLFKLICGMPKKSAAVIGEYAFRRECGNCGDRTKKAPPRALRCLRRLSVRPRIFFLLGRFGYIRQHHRRNSSFKRHGKSPSSFKLKARTFLPCGRAYLLFISRRQA